MTEHNRREQLVARLRHYGQRQAQLQADLALVTDGMISLREAIQRIDGGEAQPESNWSPLAGQMHQQMASGLGMR